MVYEIFMNMNDNMDNMLCVTRDHSRNDFSYA